jgi:hypothetical protein
MIGRQCDTPAPGTYCAGLKFFTYEAELARVEEKVCLIMIIIIKLLFILESDYIYL